MAATLPENPQARRIYGGRYEVLREIGAGGMSRVFAARDKRIGREVAVKVLAPGLTSEEQRARFEQEARAAGALQHPNVLAVFDVGEDDGEPFLVSELLSGETVRALLRRGGLDAERVRELGIQLAQGLAAAHALGVVHRDLKPENLFVTSDGRLKILDFGIAKLLPDAALTPAVGTRTGTVIGTVGYMSPEQVRGGTADVRSDVFACGAVLHEMLSGRAPFEGATPLETGHAILTDAPRRLPKRVPADLAAIVERCLQKAPDARYPSAHDLELALAGLARERKTPEIRRRERRKVVALAVLPLANLSGDPSQEYFADGMTEEIVGKLSRLAGLAVTARTSVAKYKATTRGAREIGEELGVAYLVEGSVRRAGDRIRVSATLVKTADAFQVWSESIDATLDDIFEVQEWVATRIVDALHVRLRPDEADNLRRWGTRNASAYDEYLRGQALVIQVMVPGALEKARAHFERALQIDPRFAPALAGLASAEANTYRNVDSNPERLERARQLVERALEIDPDLTRATFALGEIRGVSYDYEGAAECFRKVAQIEPRNYHAWDGLAWVLGYATPPRLAEAERAARRAIDLNPTWAEPYYHLVRVLLPQGRLAEAEDAMRHIAEQAHESGLLETGWFWLEMGRGRPDDALACVERELEFRETNLGEACRAMALSQRGQIDDAFAALDRALAKGYRDVPALAGHPYFEPLRRDPRFEKFLAEREIDLSAAPPTRRPVARNPNP